MKKFRRIIVLVLIAVMVMLVTACLCGQHFMTEPEYVDPEPLTAHLVYVRGVTIQVWGDPHESAIIF